MKVRRRYFTLMEIIVVMFFITIITGIVAYNVKGALDEGKAFRTVEGIKQLENILSMQLASNNITEEAIRDGKWQDSIKDHPLVKNWKALIKDGWGKEYIVKCEGTNGSVIVYSESLNKYQVDHPASLFKDEK